MKNSIRIIPRPVLCVVLSITISCGTSKRAGSSKVSEIQYMNLNRRGTITGRVVDAETDAPLPGVNVFIPNTQIGAATDLYGIYRISNVPPGVYSLKASFIGHESYTHAHLVVKSDQTIVVNFFLAAVSVNVDHVKVENESH